MGTHHAIRPRLLAVSLVVALVLGVGGGVLWATLSEGDEDPPEVVLGRESVEDVELPDVEVLDIDGQTVRTGGLVGRPLVVNLWYAGCAPCRREMPDLAAVADEYDGEVRFVGVNPIDDVDTMIDFADEVGVHYELFRDPDGRFTEAVRAVSFPITLFVDADGTVVAQTGEVDADDIRRQVEQLL